jgi:hypothetical protein
MGHLIDLAIGLNRTQVGIQPSRRPCRGLTCASRRIPFTTEPLPPGSLLRDLPNISLTPHMLSHTQESLAELPNIAIENVRLIFAGQLLVYVCNPDVVTRWQARWR